MVRAIVNLAAGDSPAGLILRQKQLIERYEGALERVEAHAKLGVRGVGDLPALFEGIEFIAREALGEQVTA